MAHPSEPLKTKTLYKQPTLPELGTIRPGDKTVGGKRHGVEESGQILVLRRALGVQGPRFLQRTFVRL
jgi:hypothetical protein